MGGFWLLKEPFKISFKGPSRSVRLPWVKGILARAPAVDPCLHLDGLPNPFTVYWPVSISNLYGSAIFITALLVSPPAGWTDAEQNIGTLVAGASGRFEKSNATRATGCEGTNETITVRWRYRTGSYAGPIIGYDDFDIAIYWELVSAGTVDVTDDEFVYNAGPPITYDGWAYTLHCGSDSIARVSDRYCHGAYSLRTSTVGIGHYVEITKTVSIGSGSRAGIVGFHQCQNAGRSLLHFTTPVETLTMAIATNAVWRRWGFRLNPGASNQVTIRLETAWGGAQYDWLDYIRWVRWA